MVYKLNEDLANQKLNDLVHRNIKCLDSYKGRTAYKHKFLCLVEGCGNIWEAPYATVVTSGHGCRRCADKSLSLSVKEAQSRLDNLVVRNIKCLDEYKGTQLKHTFECLVQECGNIWEAPYNTVVNQNYGCKKCAVRKTMLPISVAQTKLNQLVERDIVCLDSYKGSQLKHRFRCLKENCGHTWEAKYTAVVNRNNGCKACSKTFIEPNKAQSNLDNLILRNIQCLDKYKGSGKRHNFICLKPDCNHQWFATYNDVVNTGYGCAKCAGVSKKIGEDAVMSELRHYIRKRVKVALRRIGKDDSFTKFHNDEFLSYCQHEYYAVLPRPDGLTLDHILPMDFFDPTNDLEMRMCWHKRNLRWITKSENSSKNNKIIFDLFDDWHYLVYNLVTSGDYDTELAKSLLD